MGVGGLDWREFVAREVFGIVFAGCWRHYRLDARVGHVNLVVGGGEALSRTPDLVKLKMRALSWRG